MNILIISIWFCRIAFIRYFMNILVLLLLCCTLNPQNLQNQFIWKLKHNLHYSWMMKLGVISTITMNAWPYQTDYWYSSNFRLSVCSFLLATVDTIKKLCWKLVAIAIDSTKVFTVLFLNICKINPATNKDSQRRNRRKWVKTDMNIDFLNK